MLSETIRIRVDEDLRAALHREADRQDRRLSSLCRVLLRQGLAQLDAEHEMSPESASFTRAREE